MTTLESAKSRLSPDAYDWLVGALDPFHDFEHPIEGAPDPSIGRSYTRKFTQTATIAATADDDNISIVFTGCHGATNANFYFAGVDGDIDALAAGVPMAPIMALRTAAGSHPSLFRLAAGTATNIGSFYTAQVSSIRSRLVSIGLEVTDTTQSLYKRGTLCCAHMNATASHGNLKVTDAAASVYASVFLPSPLSVTPTDITTHPGAYIGPTAKGVYLQGRLNEIQPPSAATYTAFNASSYGAPNLMPVLTEPTGTSSRLYLLVPTVNAGDAATLSNLAVRNNWSDSGFCPFVVNMSGLSAESTLQVTIKCTVEYFPGAQHLFELGLATFSPCYEPDAFRFYHEIMRQIPAGVPVTMNSAGDFWRMIVSAARKVGAVGFKAAPTLLRAAEMASTMAGRPELAQLARAAGYGLSIANTVSAATTSKPKKKKKASASLTIARSKRL